MSKNQIRKRFFVSEGDLFQLYSNIMEVRKSERRNEFMSEFRALLRDAQEVELVVKDRKEASDG